jgi:hypothetical protein
MRTHRAVLLASLAVAGSLVLLALPRGDRAPDGPRPLFDPDRLTEEEKRSEGHAWEMFEWWYSQRAYPHERIPPDGYWTAWQHKLQHQPAPALATVLAASWTSIGPDNIGGRMLSLAIDPTDPSRVWAGAASGGLWLSTVAGEGADAWTRVETGFPSLSVSAVVLQPSDPDVMYIGTGEISRYVRPLVGTPGARSSYGLGVLKSTDGGATWGTTGLTWTFDQSRAVLSMKMDPADSDVLWAATSEGLYKTTNAGATWTLSHAELMAMDVVVDPTNASAVCVSHGQLGVPPDGVAGIYKSTDGGASWSMLGGGLPGTDFGRTPLTISADGQTLYAGVASASGSNVVGLYRSTDRGASWSLRSSTNWAGGQAWYDNVVAVSPVDEDLVLASGLDVYRSTSGGSGLSQVAYWWAGYGGVVPNGGPEGPSDYVHADQHAIVFDPGNPQTVYIACDGGVFKSTDGGVSWAGKNGGLRTTQFYAGFANGSATASLALGGLQDNGTVLWTGSDSWDKTYGGDGGWCAIDPSDEDVMYEEYVYLNMNKTTDGGASWFEVHSYSSGSANFIAPFVIAETSPDVIYAGMLAVEKSTNGGSSWFYPDGNSNWNGTQVATIGTAPSHKDFVIAGTGNSGSSPTMEVRWSSDGGASWNVVAGGQLPDRYPTDFHHDRNDPFRVWATFSGYGTGHVFESTDGGAAWTDRSANLPDIPAQSVALDPDQPAVAYVGTDLGIYRSADGGASWVDFNSGMPIAMITDLAVHAPSRKMRAATFGNGVWEIDLPAPDPTGAEIAAAAPGTGGLRLAGGRPNPFRERTTVSFTLARDSEVRLTVHDAAGRRIRTLVDGSRAAGDGATDWDGRDDSGQRVAAGVYFVRLEAAEGETVSRKLAYLR